jgi:hypothetical protein
MSHSALLLLTFVASHSCTFGNSYHHIRRSLLMSTFFSFDETHPESLTANHFSASPLRGGDGLQLHEDTCTMLIKVLNDAVSDTTNDDSSNLLVT